jgi:hypothetical protein
MRYSGGARGATHDSDAPEIREFRNEAEVAKARLPRGTKVRINGRLAETE